MTPQDFIRANAVLSAPPLVPEILLYLAGAVVPLWHATEEQLAVQGIPPPFWAFAWAGGQALARHVLDNPGLVAGKRVLDIGAGSGLVAIAAARAGAASVSAADIDPFARTAIALNAEVNAVTLTVRGDDLIGGPGCAAGQADPFDVILVGDLFYERPLAERLLAWLAGLGALVLLGDPGRSYFPQAGVEKLASYPVQTSRDLEGREMRETGVYRVARQTPSTAATG